MNTWTTLHGPALWGAVVGVMAISTLITAALIQLPPRFRRPLLVTIVFLSGLYYAVEFFWPTHKTVLPNGAISYQNPLTHYTPDVLAPMSDIVAAFMLGLGLLSLMHIHSANVIKRRPGYYNSVALIVSAITMVVIGLCAKGPASPKPAMVQTYSYLFDGLYQNLDAAMFSLIAFFILSAAYRAFRIRSVEATILMASALIVLLGLSFGVVITQSIPTEGFAANFRIETWSNWILGVISLPALRAIDFGIGLGGLAMGLRIWLGIERGALFGE